MPNKHISALLTLALGLWFLTGFSLPMTPFFIRFLGLMLFGSPVVKGLAPPLGQGFLVCLPLITVRMSIWALHIWGAVLHPGVSNLGLIFHWLY